MSRPEEQHTLEVQQFGPIQEAKVTFGDLTVFVGPQATGKSIFLQLLKLLLDVTPIRSEFKRFNIEWGGRLESFLELYFGEGMAGLYDIKQTKIIENGKPISLENILRGGRKQEERLFYIPAQRVMSLRDGTTRPFTDFRAGDPFVLREFGEKLHYLLQSEFIHSENLFPQPNRLKQEFRQLLMESIFGGFELKRDVSQFQKRIVLTRPGEAESQRLPYLVWSAGQREFVPLLLGLYWLMPPSRTTIRGKLEWVVIEEPEMGLHPQGISAVLATVLELLLRGYRVCLSTHSPHVLDVVWALQIIQEQHGTEDDVLEIFGIRPSQQTRRLANQLLESKKSLRVYFFKRDGTVTDISRLNPAAENADESGWGGLTGFSGKVSEIVARVVERAEQEMAG